MINGVFHMLMAGSSFYNWIKLLCQNKFKIGFRYLPRALLITLIVISFTPLRWFEKLWNRKINQVQITKPPLFIMGHWRMGTTFFHDLFFSDPEFAHMSFTEATFPYLFLKFSRLIKWIASFGPKTRPQDNMKFHPDFSGEHDFAIANLTLISPYSGGYFPQNQEKYNKYVSLEGVSEKNIDRLKKTYLYILKKLTLKNNMKRLVLKTPVDLGRVKLLIELFPDAKFVEIYRNPYKTFFSTKRMFLKLIPLIQLQDRVGDLDDFVFNIFTSLYQRYDEEIALIPKENFVSVKYEDLVKDPLREMERIYSKLSLPNFLFAREKMQEHLDLVKDYQVSRYSITSDEKMMIYKKWGDKIDQWGYEKPPFP